MKSDMQEKRNARISSLMKERKLSKKEAGECIDLLERAKVSDGMAELCADKNLLVAATEYRKEAMLFTRKASNIFFGVKK